MPVDTETPDDLAHRRRIAWKVTRWRVPAGVAPDVWKTIGEIAQFYLDNTDPDSGSAVANEARETKPSPKRATKKAARS